MKVQLSLLGLAMASVQVQGRQWQEIIDHEIAMKSNVDASRYELKIEADPFATTKAGEKTASKIPTVPATQHTNIQTSNDWNSIDSHSAISTPNTKPSFSVVTGSVTAETSKESNSQPSSNSWNSLNSAKPNQNSGSAPILSQESVTGCVKYELHMMDTWGDGWGKMSLTITGIGSSTASTETTHTNSQGDEVVSISKTVQMNAASKQSSIGQIFQGSLEQGFHDSKEICFVTGQCYQLVTSGGDDVFGEEASWELRPAGMEDQVLLSGGAATGCTFSLPDENGHHACPKTCGNAKLANAVTSSAPVAGSTKPEMPEAFGAVNVLPRSNP